MARYYIQRTDKGFGYITLGSESHGRYSFKLWVNNRLIKKDEDGNEFVEFPVKDAQVVKTEKGSLVLRPAKGVNTFEVGRHCGYRGSSTFEVVEPEPLMEARFEIWDSPQGSLGISEYGLVSVASDYVKVKETATGRLYGKPDTYYHKYTVDGKVVEFEPCADDEELCDLLD